jgi:hypothetical protein
MIRACLVGLLMAVPSLPAVPDRALPATRIAWLWDGADALPAAAAGPALQAAVVVQHLLLSGDRLLVRPRPRAPALPPGTRVTPVVHVELSTVRPPAEPDRHSDAIVAAVLQAARRSSSGWVQLDMETRPSQRAFHRQLVHELRRSLPADIRLSVTALAWWCREPHWLDELEADEVVPMFFSMGRDSETLRLLIAQDAEALHPRCRHAAAGFSIQEPFDHETTDRYRKTYWFDAHRWQDGARP